MITGDPSYGRQMRIPPSLNRERLAAILLLSGAYDIEPVDLEGEFGWFVRRFPVSAGTTIGSD
jgi:acetyl esterase